MPQLYRLLVPFLALALAAPARVYFDPPAGMLDIYQQNRRLGTPNYITSDFVLLAYSLELDRAFAATEENQMLPTFRRIVDTLLASAAKQPAGQARADCLDGLAVLQALLNGQTASDRAPVAAELKKIYAADGISRSDLLLQTIDYSQFKPRGRYTRNPRLENYFRAYRYAGTALFYIQPSAATGVTADDANRLTASSLLLASLIRKDANLSASYNSWNTRLDALAGRSEDLTLSDLASVPPGTAPEAAAKLLLDRARKTHHQPRILAASVDVSKIEPGFTAADVLTGWRFLPLRYTPDTAGAQLLTYDHVKRYLGTAQPRSLTTVAGLPVKGFPLALEIVGLLGSQDALRELDKTDERNYEGYADAFKAAQTEIRNGSGLVAGQLKILEQWLAEKPAAGADRRLNGALGFWTWSKYNNLLYSKQSYTAVSKAAVFNKPRSAAYLEPATGLYLALAAQLTAVAGNFAPGSLAAATDLLRTCAAISKSEDARTPLSKTQVDFLNDLDATLLQSVGQPDRPIVVDVHTDPKSGMVLEEALAFPSTAQYTLPDGATAVGGAFAPREFKRKISERLDDEEWLTLLEKEAAEKETKR
jgi:hypothetical protein